MPFADAYLEKNNLSKTLPSPPPYDLIQVIVIPCHKEPDLLSCLESLYRCHQPPANVEVIIIINSAEGASQEILDLNRSTLEQANKWISDHQTSPVADHRSDHQSGQGFDQRSGQGSGQGFDQRSGQGSGQPPPWISFYPLLYPDFPEKYAGPGLARKTGMDLAVSRFNTLDRPRGIITSLDADTTVEPNYLQTIQELFNHDPQCIGCNVHFEHPLEGDPVSPTDQQAFTQTGPQVDTQTGPQVDTQAGAQVDTQAGTQSVTHAIIQYELHLRYYVQALRYSGFPYAFHTIGSIFSVRADAYVRQGGMNRRKAGEDFYFLQKLIPLGGFRELHATTVYPSARPSDRVPFGTGSFISKFIHEREAEWETYHPDAFTDLKALFDIRDSLFGVDKFQLSQVFETFPEPVREFIGGEYLEKLQEINQHSASLLTFRKRFHAWFNAFKVLKFLNFAHDKHYKKIPVTKAIHSLLKTAGTVSMAGTKSTSRELLSFMRELQKSGY